MEPKPKIVSAGRAYLLYFGLLFGAMLAASSDPHMFVFAYMFPFGMAMWFHTPTQGTGTVLPLIAYLIYGVFFVLFGIFRQRPGFYLLCIAFIIYLILNVAGCHEMLKGFEHVT
jgi:hypothetical protein